MKTGTIVAGLWAAAVAGMALEIIIPAVMSAMETLNRAATYLG